MEFPLVRYPSGTWCDQFHNISYSTMTGKLENQDAMIIMVCLQDELGEYQLHNTVTVHVLCAW